MDLARSLIAGGPYTLLDLREANRRWALFRSNHDAAATHPKLFTDPAHNAKFTKTLDKTGTSVYGLALAQAESSLLVNACRFSTPECRAGCVSMAGRGVYWTVQNGRIRRTLFLYEDPSAFLTLVTHELHAIWKKHGRLGRVRLNTFSDVPWERVRPELFGDLPKLRFYDYTKWPIGKPSKDWRVTSALVRRTPPNYRLIYSASEKTKDADIVKMVQGGSNVAVVFDVKRMDDLPKRWMGCKVIDGDKNDDRSGDPKGVIIGLRSKGKMRKQNGTMPRKVA